MEKKKKQECFNLTLLGNVTYEKVEIYSLKWKIIFNVEMYM